MPCNQCKAIIIILSSFILIIVMAGCSGTKPGNGPETTPNSTVSPTAVSKNTTGKTDTTSSTKAPAQNVAKSTPTPTAKKTPKLTDNTFTLTLLPAQEYVENPVPIYLLASQVLHISWMVIKGGDHFHMTFTLPNGTLIGVTSTGKLSSYLHGESSTEKLTKNGDLVFQPGNNDWGDGYYIFHPQIYKDDASITVKLLYWIE
jgi:hypothetical protein